MMKRVQARSSSVPMLLRSPSTGWTTIAFLLGLGGLTSASETFGGEDIFSRQCANCHQVGEGAKHKVGPHLDRLFGRKAGSAEGFRYSDAMAEAGNGGLSWDAESLSAYLEKPREFIKGNRMSFRGMADADDRAALINWLESATSADPNADVEDAASVLETGAPSFAETILKIESDIEYGEYLAGDCVTCHQVSGRADGIPSIVGIPKDYFVRAIVEYRTNVRRNEVMKSRVQNLADEEIAHLAAYFASLEPQ